MVSEWPLRESNPEHLVSETSASASWAKGLWLSEEDSNFRLSAYETGDHQHRSVIGEYVG